jgi:hypothetical protein
MHLLTVMHSTIIHRQSCSLSPQAGFGKVIAHSVNTIVAGCYEGDNMSLKVYVLFCNKGMHRSDTAARSSWESRIHIMVYYLVSSVDLSLVVMLTISWVGCDITRYNCE